MNPLSAIWPRLVEAPHIMEFAQHDLGAINALFAERGEVFGVSSTFASPDERALIATNKLNLWKQRPEGHGVHPVTPPDPAEDPDTARALLSLVGGTAEVMQFAAKEGLRPAPVEKLRWISTLYTREAFFLTDEGYRRAANAATPDQPGLNWPILASETANLDAAGHIERSRGTDLAHYGASVLTVLVGALPSSNHQRLGWEVRLKKDINAVLRYRGAMARGRMQLHPDWSVAAALEPS